MLLQGNPQVTTSYYRLISFTTSEWKKWNKKRKTGTKCTKSNYCHLPRLSEPVPEES